MTRRLTEFIFFPDEEQNLYVGSISSAIEDIEDFKFPDTLTEDDVISILFINPDEFGVWVEL